MKKVWLLAFCVSLSGCMSLGKPALTYADTGHPHSDTAIFAVEGYNNATYRGAIWRVDGRSMRKFSMGAELPVWVRVLPGTHTFKISYFKNGDAPMTRDVANVERKVADMKPRHVYLAKLHDYGDKYRIVVEDLGEDSHYVEHIPPVQSASPGDYPASF